MPSEQPLPAEVLICAPTGRDAESAKKLLGDQGIAARIVGSIDTLSAAICDGTGAVVLTSEALSQSPPAAFIAALERQPPWSDLAIILLTARQIGPSVGSLLPSRATNIVLLERPLTGESLLSAVRSALSARRRQYEIRDLTAALEQQVETRTQERDRIWQTSQDLLGVSDTQGVWLNINPAWNAVLGWSDAEVLGKTSEWLEHPEDHEKTRAQLARLAAGIPTSLFENRFRTRSGAYRTLSWRAVPYEGLCYCSARDVTDERAREAALHQAEEQLRQSQKMEVLGQLTGGIAHDFNNILQGITGSLLVVQKRLEMGLTSDLRRYLDIALRSAFRAAGLTHHLLAFSRRQPLDPRSVAVNNLVENMADLLKRTLGERITLDFQLGSNVRNILCDPNQLESAILNLAINARDAMTEGGVLTVKTLNGGEPGAPAATPAGKAVVWIGVADTGSGMSAEVLEHAFEPFYTTKPLGRGTGLGLSMIYGFARQSDGQCIIQSALGKGTTVWICLPQHEGAAAETTPANVARPLVGRSENTVLVAEDDEVVRALVVEALSEAGYRVMQAFDGPTALHMLEGADTVDVLVTDIGLPGLDGRRLADEARRTRKDLKILFMTGYAQDATSSRGFLQPGMMMITKPFAIESLIEHVGDMTAPSVN